jgi:hypothetical protein
MSSLDTFISGQSVVTAFGDHVPTSARSNNHVHQYEEEEEEEEENAPDQVSIKLAERTSSLINSFKEYIADLSDRDEEMMLGNSSNSRNSTDWSERTQDIGIVKLDWSERTDDIMVDRMNKDWSDRSGLSGMSGGLSDSIIERMSHIAGGSDSSYTVSPTRRVPPLLRDWDDHPRTTSNLSALAMKHKKFNEYNEDDSSYEEKKYHYTHNSYKRVKRLGVVGVIVLIVTLIAIMVPSSNKRRNGNTTTPSALRKEEKKTEMVSLLLEQEQNDQEEGEDKVDNPETKYVEEEKESVASTINDEETVVQNLYASAFSNTIQDVEEDFDITLGGLVPKESSFNPVIRPGPEYFIEEEETESSTSNVESNMDDVDNPETKYVEEEKESVASTIDDEETVVQNLYASAFSNTVQDVEENFDITSGGLVPKESSFNPVIRPGPEYFIEEEEAESSTSNVESNVDDTILLVHNQFKPVWLSSKEGWNGGSYDDAVALCSSFREPKQLCPYSAMCPHGPGGAIMGGLELSIEGEQYAPVMGGKNHWVMIGNVSSEINRTTIESKDKDMSTCQTHRQFHGKNPDWGFNGDRRELKQYIMCCTVDTM